MTVMNKSMHEQKRYFHENSSIARHTGGRIELALAAVASRYIGAHPPEPPVYRIHSRRGFRRLEDCRYDMNLAERWPDLSSGQYVYVWGMLWNEQDAETPFSISCYSPVKIYINGSMVFQSNLNDDVFPDRKAYFRAKTQKGRNDIVLEFVAVGTGCGGIFGTGSVKGAPLHFLDPTDEPGWNGCEGWVYSEPQQKPWSKLPGCDRHEGAGSSRVEDCRELTAWHPHAQWSAKELEGGCFSRMFGPAHGAKAFAWCKLDVRGAMQSDLMLKGSYQGDIAVYVNGHSVFQGEGEDGRFEIQLQNIAYGTHDLVVESVCRGEEWGFIFHEPGMASIRFVPPYPVEGMVEPWLYLGVFSEREAPSAAEIIVMDKLFGQGKEAAYWRVDRPDCWVRPYLESPLYGRWNYPLGVTLYGLLKTGAALSAPHYTQYAADHIEQCSKLYEYAQWDRDRYGAPGINHQLVLIDSLDDCGSFGAAMLEAHKLRPLQGVEGAAAHIAHYITEVQDRLPGGAFYRTRGTVDFMQDTMWCDDLYMSTPFLCKYYELTGNEAYLDDAASQFLQYKARLFIPELGIMHHVFDDKFGKPNGVPWGRGNGWVIFSLTELLNIMPPNHRLRPELLNFYCALCQGYRELQSDSGMWHQVLTDSESYDEASCTAMFIYAFAHGVRNGWLEEPALYVEAAMRGWKGLSERCIDAHGNVYGVCRGSGYSFNKLYYKDELTWQLNDTHGIGIILLAGIEILRLGQKGGSVEDGTGCTVIPTRKEYAASPQE